MSYTKEDVWKYHAEPRPGKVEVLPSKRGETQDDLTLAYSPGVADACRAIEADPAAAASLTARSNLVAVVSNGTAVLGLGNIGPLAGKPVMEGKGMLFKMFADVDVFDLELATTDPDELINVVKTLEPTFGGINLEDIKAPECFYIEQKLKEIMNIPVFHDDQHGTAVISGAGLINAAHIAGRKMEDMKVVVVGAGAAGIACANFYVSLGVKRENIWMFDSKGLIHKGRQDKLHPTKAAFAQEKDATLAEAMQGAHVFLGLSKPGLVTQDMVRSMASHPVIFACANPVPEITYAEAKAARPAHGHRPLRLPQPDQQRVRLPLHLPRRPGRAGHGDQRSHEAGRCRGPGHAGPRRRARRSEQGLRRQEVQLRPRLHHPQPAGSAHHRMGDARRGPCRHGKRRGPRPHRGSGRLPRRSARTRGPHAPSRRRRPSGQRLKQRTIPLFRTYGEAAASPFFMAGTVRHPGHGPA